MDRDTKRTYPRAPTAVTFLRLKEIMIRSIPVALIISGLVTIGLVYLLMGPPEIRIGGPFTLVDHRGKTVTERDYLGKPMFVFFGYTSCPDVCPTTLYELSNQLKELGPEADHLNVLFVTVDPDRDTPEKLSLYLSSFDPHITGLSGSEKNIKTMMAAYRATARKVPTPDGDYTMDHTALVHMMNSKGRFVGGINYQEPEAAVRAKIHKFLDKAA
jgi:protein SCO1/2